MPETTSPNIAILISKLLTGTLSESETRYPNEWVTADTTGRRAKNLKKKLHQYYAKSYSSPMSAPIAKTAAGE